MHRSPQFKMVRWTKMTWLDGKNVLGNYSLVDNAKVFARGAIDNTRLLYNRSIKDFTDVNEALTKPLQDGCSHLIQVLSVFFYRNIHGLISQRQIQNQPHEPGTGLCLIALNDYKCRRNIAAHAT